MKFKKIASLLISSVMAFSVLSAVVSAVEPAPKANFKVTAYTQEEAVELGVTPDDGKALYYISLNISDLGDLNYIEEGSGLKKTTRGTKITGLKISLTGDIQLILLDAENQKLKFDTFSGQLANGIKFEYLDTGKATAYPSTKGTSLTNASMEDVIGAFVVAPIGLTPSFSANTIQITTWGTAASYEKAPWYDFEMTPFTFNDPNPTTAVKKLGLTIDGTDAKKENGYIWKLGLTQENGAKADSFTADFKDSEGLTNTKTARNDVSKFFGGEGAVEFYVGLKTKRTITEFKATVADSTAEGVTASATWTAAE